jgi:putative glutamine amidotransferase
VTSAAAFRPIIGLTAYRKSSTQTPPAPLFALMPTYIEAVSAAGGIPILIPIGLDEAALASVLARLDGLVLPGGGDIAGDYYQSQHPDFIFEVDDDRDRAELYLARQAVARRLPLLAICRGHQMLNVALGGTLYEDVMQFMPGAIKHDFFTLFPRNHLAHEVTVEPESRLAAALGVDSVCVNSLHHQGIRDLAPGLIPAAHAPDGLIEAVEAVDHPFAVGVQWHPENLYLDNPDMLALFRGLVEAAAAVRA